MLKEYIESASLPASVREVYQLNTDLKEKHKLYLNLIPLISPLFPKVTPDNLKTVGAGGYLYFRFLLDLDSLLDEREGMTENQIFQKLNVTFEIYEEAIKVLSSVFRINSVFWDKFRHFKSEYSRAIFSEKQFSKSRMPFTEDVFERLAAGKSAICYASVSALSTLNGYVSDESKLEQCLRHVHIALQYLDDIEDFKKDIDNEQWTYPQYLVGKYLSENTLAADTNLTHKYLFVSGIAGALLDKASGHYQKAIDFTEELGLQDLNVFLQKQQCYVRFYKKEVEFLMQKTASKKRKSMNIQPAGLISMAIRAANNYLTMNRSENVWSDFMTSAGGSDAWVTAFAGMMLAETDYSREMLELTLTCMPKNYAFSNSMLQDADSSSFMAGFHYCIHGGIPEELVASWLNFMNTDGSWSTYRDGEKVRERLELSSGVSVDGWLSSHACVTAAAAYVLSGIPALRKEYLQSGSSLVNLILDDNKIEAYWWTSDLYATAFALLALCKHPLEEIVCEWLIEGILEQQDEQGCWKNPADNTPCAFYTALALKAMIEYRPEEYSEKIEIGIRWLMNNQTEDGSWFSGRILRIPATDVRNPKHVVKWRNSSFGVNVLVDDYNRVFTTAMVVNALHKYLIIKQSKNDH